MTDTPLRRYLTETGISAEEFAASNSLSAWNVRHWSRGNKEPSIKSQLELETATNGLVKPSDWLEWKLARPTTGEAA